MNNIDLSSIVRIYRQNSDKPIGGGFLFNNKSVLTCAHVIENALGIRESQTRPDGVVKIDFPQVVPIFTINGEINYWNRDLDIAVLNLIENLPDSYNIHPARLKPETVLFSRKFQAFGFPENKSIGIWSKGEIRNPVAKGWYQTVSDPGPSIEPGFSGTAVWDGDLSGVVGMVVASDSNTMSTRTAFFLPISKILETLYRSGESTFLNRPIHQEKFAQLDLALPMPSPKPAMNDHIYISPYVIGSELGIKISLDLKKAGHLIWGNDNIFLSKERRLQNIVDGIFYASTVVFILSEGPEPSEQFLYELQSTRQFNKAFVVIAAESAHTIVDLEGIFGAQEFPLLIFKNYEKDLNDLIKSDLLPTPVKVSKYCQALSSELKERANDDHLTFDRYIPEESRILTNAANPDRANSLKGERENLISQLLNIKQNALVLGEPGAGKTVVLERFAWELANKEIKTELPILISLTEVRESTIKDRILAKIKNTHELEIDTKEEALLFLKNKRGYILLDGLNEVEAAHQPDLISEILKLDEPFNRFRIVVTSRRKDDVWRELQKTRRFETFVIQDITEHHVRNYLKACLQSMEAELLWKSLDQNLIELIRTPLLLKLLKDYWLTRKDHHNFQMPKNKGELYEEFINARIDFDNLPNEKRYAMISALEKLAFKMQTEDIWKEINWNEALGIIQDREMINELIKREFLVESNGYLRFPHHTFQEFYAARSMQRNFEKYIEYARDVKWLETFILLAGIAPTPDKLVSAIASVDAWLAFWCIDEGQPVSASIKTNIEDRSIRLVSSPNMVDRLEAAGSLSAIQNERTIPHLIKLLKDPIEEVSETAIYGLSQLGEAPAPRLLDEFNKTGLDLDQRLKLARTMGLTQDLRYGVMPKTGQEIEIDWVQIFGSEIGKGSNQPLFSISRYLITNAQYGAFLTEKQGASSQWWVPGEQGYKVLSDLIPSWMKYDDFSLPNAPAVYVSWHDAVLFCKWLSSMLCYEVRLLTEAEWIAAAQAEINRTILKSEFPDPSRVNSYESGIVHPTPVGAYPDYDSRSNIKDMIGNIFCWTLTKWRQEITEPEDNDLQGDEPRVIRGSSFIHSIHLHRMGEFPKMSNFYTGFRIVRAENKESK